jgi:dTDP-4-amino-4,6-dideoxygalactose transaminase
LIPFNRPCVLGTELKKISDVFTNEKFSGDGHFSKKCHEHLKKKLNVKKALLTTSCTDALEMAALLINLKPGDEVIMPSFTFVSTANAFALRGATIVFIDIDPLTMNLDLACLTKAITKNTKAIVVVHYGGWCCDMKELKKVCNDNNLFLIEDAAQSYLSTFQNKSLGSWGDLSCLSFHETKNIQCGEGGALLINQKELVERAEIIREKGTNRSKFFRGQVDKYSWVDLGSSFLPSELNAAFLLAQLEDDEVIIKKRIDIWNQYQDELSEFEFAKPLSETKINGHLFALKLKDLEQRTLFIEFMKNKKITTSFHYIPLHSSEAGKKFGRFHGQDHFTTRESERIARLPLYHALTQQEVSYITKTIKSFFEQIKRSTTRSS